MPSVTVIVMLRPGKSCRLSFGPGRKTGPFATCVTLVIIRASRNERTYGHAFVHPRKSGTTGSYDSRSPRPSAAIAAPATLSILLMVEPASLL